jgi:hypothetical protein
MPSAEDIRNTLSKREPAFLALADSLRAQCGARITAIKCGELAIGWDKWEAVRAQCVTWVPAPNFDRAKQEWKRIKEHAFGTRAGAGTGAKRRGAQRVLRGAEIP